MLDRNGWFGTPVKDLFDTRAWDYKLALAVVTLTTVGSALRTAFNLGYNRGTFEHVNLTHATCCVNFLESYVLPISIALFISTFGLWWRKSIAFLISLLALGGVMIVYIFWHLNTLSLMHKAEVKNFIELPNQRQHLLTLGDATWWDLVVLTVAITLFVWQIKILIIACRSSIIKRYA